MIWDGVKQQPTGPSCLCFCWHIPTIPHFGDFSNKKEISVLSACSDYINIQRAFPEEQQEDVKKGRLSAGKAGGMKRRKASLFKWSSLIKQEKIVAGHENRNIAKYLISAKGKQLLSQFGLLSHPLFTLWSFSSHALSGLRTVSRQIWKIGCRGQGHTSPCGVYTERILQIRSIMLLLLLGYAAGGNCLSIFLEESLCIKARRDKLRHLLSITA